MAGWEGVPLHEARQGHSPNNPLRASHSIPGGINQHTPRIRQRWSWLATEELRRSEEWAEVVEAAEGKEDSLTELGDRAVVDEEAK